MRKQASFIFGIRVIRLAFAILNLSFSAKYFGVSFQRDVWLLALNAIVILDIAIWAPLNDTFRAKFLFIKAEKGEEEALQQTRSLLLFINLITFLLVAFIMLFPGSIGRLLAPAYGDIEQAELRFMIRVVAPSFLLNQITKILTSILNTYNAFIIPEITGFITQVFTLVVILTLAPSMGIISLAISYYVGLILLLVMLLMQLNKREIKLFKGVSKITLRQALPFFTFSLPFFYHTLVPRSTLL
ncbi:lipid II flippase MurJ [Pedobacter sp. P26]|uniref:lipid II flippase MurJ n=1 Tax=Pedobacter sp. P26 TaxID=3423956 RepID=UPI003D66FCCE